MERQYPVTTDLDLNTTLQAESSAMRGMMLDAAEQFPASERFTFETHPHHAAMIITDTETGRVAEVGLFAYGAVRQVFHALFDVLPDPYQAPCYIGVNAGTYVDYVRTTMRYGGIERPVTHADAWLSGIRFVAGTKGIQPAINDTLVLGKNGRLDAFKVGKRHFVLAES